MIKKLYRSKEDKLVGGVLGGIATYYGHDPVLFRLGFIILLALTGIMPFVLVYLIAWVLIPQEPPIAAMSKEDYVVQDEPEGA